jgi:cytochrome c
VTIETNFIRPTARQLWTVRLVAAMLVAMWCGAVQAAGDAARGAVLYQGCEDCHSIDKNDVGPLHRGVVGRKAGSVPDYDYSPALKNSNIVWTEDNLDKWLTNPQGLVPGTKMFFQVNGAKDRADLIAFLKEHPK